MKNSHDPLSKDFESHLTFLFNNIHATTKISFSLFDKEFHLLSSLSNWKNYVSNFFFLNCPFTPEDLAGSKAHAPFYFSDVLHLNWFIFPLTASESFLVFGPVFETEVTPVYFQKKLDFQNMSVSSQIRFLKMLKDIPVVPYMQPWCIMDFITGTWIQPLLFPHIRQQKNPLLRISHSLN